MKRKGFWIATGLLVVPVAIFYILSAGTHHFKSLPIYGERIPPNGNDIKDTIFYQIPDYFVKDQSGVTISSQSFQNSIYVANFFFASCKDVCPTMNRRLAQVYDKYREFAEVQFISFTVDPKNDTLEVLEAYAKKYNADPKIWHFGRAEKEALLQIGQGFLLPVSIEDKTIDHSQQFILVDKEKHIRGIYDSFSDVEIKRLEEDIKVLLYEYHHPGK
ncbi:MAG: SCO family protein [Bacteroidia bacterium]|nr:SCO family protein [Bacteroidia bacterium]MCF8445505.1 SCO family protein [Bacteroidia bacterium]